MENRPTQTSWPIDTSQTYTGAEPSNQPPVLQQARQQAGHMVDQARSQAMSQLEHQKQRAAGSLGNVAQAFRQTGEQLREQEQAPLGQFADRAADAVERLSGYLSQREARQLIHEVENFARSQPALFLGGAFALGLCVARFLKSSDAGSGDISSSYRVGSYSSWAEAAPAGTMSVPYETAGAGVSATAFDDTGLGTTPVPTEPLATAADEEEDDIVAPLGQHLGGRLSDDERSPAG